MLWIWFPLTQTAHHPWTTFPIMHCTHTFPSTITPITQLSPFTHHSDCLTTPAPHSLTHIKAAHKHSPSAKSCFALATFLSVLPRICYLCVWPRTARPSISEPVPVTSTPAWYCLRLCFASDIPVFACWPLPVWFCPRLINIGAIGSARLRPLPYRRLRHTRIQHLSGQHL